jgi:hypothetical protein
LERRPRHAAGLRHRGIGVDRSGAFGFQRWTRCRRYDVRHQ